MSAVLEAPVWEGFKARIRRNGLTPSGLLVAAYAETLARWSAGPRFTLNLTLFNRLPLHDQVNDVVGDFSSSTCSPWTPFPAHPSGNAPSASSGSSGKT